MRRDQDAWYRRTIRDSKSNDKKRGRKIDPNERYVNTCDLLRFQQIQQNKCWYCNCEMHWLERRRNKRGLTLERIDNALPHYLSNCRGLCCKSCNSKKFSTERGLLKRYFSKWRDLALNVHITTTGRRSAVMTS